MVFLKESFTTVWNMDMVFFNIAIIPCIKATGKITCSTEMENMFGVMVEFIKDNGKMIKCRDRVKYCMKMDVFIKDSSIMISSMVMVYWCGQLVKVIKAIGTRAFNMVLVYLKIQKVKRRLVFGKVVSISNGLKLEISINLFLVAYKLLKKFLKVIQFLLILHKNISITNEFN